MKTLKDFGSFLKKKGYGERTVEEYSRHLQRFFDSLKTTSVTPRGRDYRRYLDQLRQGGLSPKTISQNILAFKAFSKFLKASGAAATAATNQLNHPLLALRRLRILNGKEIECLRKTVQKDLTTDCLLELLLQTGLTISEAARLRVGQITFVSGPRYGRITLSPTRQIPINNRLERILGRYLKSQPHRRSNFLFPGRKGHLNIRTIRHKLNTAFHQAGIENFTVNDLRHSFIHHQLKKGVDAGMVAHWVGFKNLATINRFLKDLGGRKITPVAVREI